MRCGETVSARGGVAAPVLYAGEGTRAEERGSRDAARRDDRAWWGGQSRGWHVVRMRVGVTGALAVTVLGVVWAGDGTLSAATPSVGVVSAPGAPVTLGQVKLLNADSSPLVLLYAATNGTDTALDQFTVTVFVFDKDKRLKSRQVAPGRRTLNGRETKFSAMVIDVGLIEGGDSVLVGVDQAQEVGSDDWWRADLRTLAEKAMAQGAR